MRCGYCGERIGLNVFMTFRWIAEQFCPHVTIRMTHAEQDYYDGVTI